MISQVLINGDPSDGMVPVTDSSVLRGDGCFEVLKAYDGRPFGLDAHLDRLTTSAALLEIDLPDRADISRWVTQTAASLGDGAVRIVVTRGSSLPDAEDRPRVIVFGHESGNHAGPARLGPVVAPWHAAGVEWDLAGAKLLSYAPNLAATRRAKKSGFDDALLITTEGLVLEGPTFSIAWVIEDVLETPSLELGILDSITRKVVLDSARELGIAVDEGVWNLDRIGQATEALAMSTVREVQSVVEVGDLRYSEGPVTKRLAEAFAEMVGRPEKSGNP